MRPSGRTVRGRPHPPPRPGRSRELTLPSRRHVVLPGGAAARRPTRPRRSVSPRPRRSTRARRPSRTRRTTSPQPDSPPSAKRAAAAPSRRRRRHRRRRHRRTPSTPQPRPRRRCASSPTTTVPAGAPTEHATPRAPPAAGAAADARARNQPPYGRTVNDLADRLDDSRFFSSLFDFSVHELRDPQARGPGVRRGSRAHRPRDRRRLLQLADGGDRRRTHRSERSCSSSAC